MLNQNTTLDGELIKSINDQCKLFYQLGKIGSTPKKQEDTMNGLDKEKIIEGQISYLSGRITNLIINLKGI